MLALHSGAGVKRKGIQKMSTEIRVIYEDESVLVVYKPAGIATQTARIGQKDMESMLRNARAEKGEEPYIGIVHRLDQPVEGVMVFAKTKDAAAKLSKQVQSRAIGKHYYAVTTQIPESTEGTLTDYLFFQKRENVSVVTGAEHKGAKKAELAYVVMAETSAHALLDIQLKTGRHHQIRAQLSHMGCPISGDGKYGQTESKRTVQLALCSYRIAFDHPVNGKRMEFSIVPEGKSFEEFREVWRNS